MLLMFTCKITCFTMFGLLGEGKAYGGGVGEKGEMFKERWISPTLFVHKSTCVRETIYAKSFFIPAKTIFVGNFFSNVRPQTRNLIIFDSLLLFQASRVLQKNLTLYNNSTSA